MEIVKDTITPLLAKLPNEALIGVDNELNIARLEIELTAVESCPVRTGRLKGSIQSRKNGFLSYEVFDGVKYGAYVNYGTSRTAPNPFMTNSAEIVLPLLVERIRELIERLGKKA